MMDSNSQLSIKNGSLLSSISLESRVIKHHESEEIFLIELSIARTSMCQNIDELSINMTEGIELRMIREPENETDDMSIGIYYEDNRIGYVPIEYNLILSRLMDAGKTLRCNVSKIVMKYNWPKIYVKISMIEN